MTGILLYHIETYSGCCTKQGRVATPTTIQHGPPRWDMFQYGVLSSLFMPAIVNSTRISYIVGLVRLCLGSTMTSSDLPPDLHSNHIETYYAEVSNLTPKEYNT